MCLEKIFMSNDEREARAINDAIQRQINQEKRKTLKIFRLLLLGTGEAGKTTFLKQMHIIKGSGFPIENRKIFVEKIFKNIYQILSTLAEAMKNLEIDYENIKNYLEILPIITNGKNGIYHLTKDDGILIKAFWEDTGVQNCYSRCNEFQLIDPAEYFLSAIDRITDDTFVPSEQDILRTRDPTTNITEEDFHVDSVIFKIIDVGGQKSERKKWLHVFSNITSILYLVAISEFDQCLFEDETENRLIESRALFYKIINYGLFENVSFMLFLNKVDLFNKKIAKHPTRLAEYFPEYTGKPGDDDASRAFVLNEFKKQKDSDKHLPKIYSHFTCATDTKNIKVVFNFIQATILDGILGDSNLI